MNNCYPYGESFQTQVLALMVRDPQFLPCHGDIIDSSYFDDDEHSLVASALLDFYAEKNVVPQIDTVKILLTDRGAVNGSGEKLQTILTNLTNLDLTDSAIITEKIVEFGRSKLMEKLLYQLTELHEKGEPSDSMWEYIDRCRVQGSATGGSGFNISANLVEAPEIIARDGLYAPTLKVGTMFPSLDALFEGGLGRKEVGVVLGYTGIGKSTFLVNLGAAGLYQRLPVVHMSIGELEESDIYARYASRLSGFPIKEITGVSAAAYKKTMDQFMAQYQPLLVTKYFSPYTAVSTLRSFLSRFQHVYRTSPVLVVIDNADDLSSSKRRTGGDLYEELGQVYIELKSMAHDYNILIWTDSQTNRSGGRQEVADMESIADSHKKARKCDVMISVNQKPEEYDEGKLRIGVIKTRRYSKKSHIVSCLADYSRYIVREDPNP